MEKIDNLESLKQKAKSASLNSYSPYSKFKVGVAFEDLLGNVFTGCNVENMAFPTGICAEQAAIAKAISEVGPAMKVKTIVIYTPSEKVTSPCGSCRQVINEFKCPETRVVSFCDSEAILDMRFNDLLPESTVIEGLS